MIRCFVALLLALWAPAQSLRIGTWNLEQFGSRPDPSRTGREHEAIADYIRRLDVAVLAVQEIGGEEPLADLCRRIGRSWRCVLGRSGGHSDGKGRISVGFLFDDDRVELLLAEELLDLPRALEGQPIFHRLPVTACFRARDGGTDFRLVTVHLKAGRKEADFHKRRLEVATLRDWLLRLCGSPDEDQDVIVLGDFNHSYDAEARELFERGDLVRYLTSCKPSDPTIVHFDAPIDMIAVHRGCSEVEADTFEVHNEDGLTDVQRWRSTYSDHFPVTVALRSGPDDDPAATFARQPAHALPVLGGAAAAQDPAPPEEPIRAGMRVQVITLNGRFEGQLLRPLGEWIHLRANDGRVTALPLRNVVAVTQL